MKKCLITLMIFCTISSLILAQNQGIRKGIFNKKTANVINTEPNEYSFLTLGTMFGISYSLNDMTTYKVTNGIVNVNKTGTGADRLLPAVYAFPSINLYGSPGKSLSMIVPVNINPSAELALGVGLSYGFNTFQNSAEVGISFVSIWSNMETLNDAQKYSLDNHTVLPVGESSVFSKSKVISFGIGIYVVPLIK